MFIACFVCFFLAMLRVPCAEKARSIFQKLKLKTHARRMIYTSIVWWHFGNLTAFAMTNWLLSPFALLSIHLSSASTTLRTSFRFFEQNDTHNRMLNQRIENLKLRSIHSAAEFLPWLYSLLNLAFRIYFSFVYSVPISQATLHWHSFPYVHAIFFFLQIVVR